MPPPRHHSTRGAFILSDLQEKSRATCNSVRLSIALHVHVHVHCCFGCINCAREFIVSIIPIVQGHRRMVYSVAWSCDSHVTPERCNLFSSGFDNKVVGWKISW